MCFFFQAEDGIRDYKVTGVQTCALPICKWQQMKKTGEGTPAGGLHLGLDANGVAPVAGPGFRCGHVDITSCQEQRVEARVERAQPRISTPDRCSASRMGSR